MDAVGQSAALRSLFSRIYAERTPKRLAVLGCTTGSDLEQVDPAVTEMAVGVDINRTYLEIAEARLKALGPRLLLVHGDVLSAELPPGQFDLVHIALLLEYVDPLRLLRRIHHWLSSGGACSVITQQPMPDLPPVGDTEYRSLQILAARMSLRDADEVAALGNQARLRLVHRAAVDLPSRKRLVCSIFERDDDAAAQR